MKILKNYFFVICLIIIILGFIFAKKIDYLGYSDFGYILAFIGVLATFVVIGNYVQVQQIRSDMENRIGNLEKNVLNKLDKDSLEKQINQKLSIDDITYKKIIDFYMKEADNTSYKIARYLLGLKYIHQTNCFIEQFLDNNKLAERHIYFDDISGNLEYTDNKQNNIIPNNIKINELYYSFFPEEINIRYTYFKNKKQQPQH